MLIRGISRYADEIKNFPINLDDFNEAIKTQNLIKNLINILSQEKEYYFSKYEFFSKSLMKEEEKNQFTNYFKNIAKIMDCVDCLKCRVYGKMQVLGLATALRKLLNEEPIQLTRNELVALINTLKKWVESIKIMNIFRDELTRKKQNFCLCIFALFILTTFLVSKLKSLHNEFKNKTKVEKNKKTE